MARGNLEAGMAQLDLRTRRVVQTTISMDVMIRVRARVISFEGLDKDRSRAFVNRK